MIYAVTTMFHDHNPYIEYVDTEKLDPNDFVESSLLAAIKAKEEYCVIDAENWEDEPEKFSSQDGDIGISSNASSEKCPKGKKIDGAIILMITFG